MLDHAFRFFHIANLETTCYLLFNENWISRHIARWPFCTNEDLTDTLCDLNIAISGHKTENAFRIYIREMKNLKRSSNNRSRL